MHAVHNLELEKRLSISLESDNSPGEGGGGGRKNLWQNGQSRELPDTDLKATVRNTMYSNSLIFSDMWAAVSGFPQQRIQKYI